MGWPRPRRLASRQIRLSLKLGQPREGVRSVGNRRCPFRFRVPIPCLNNLDIYKQTAAARLPHCEGVRARLHAEIKYPD